MSNIESDIPTPHLQDPFTLLGFRQHVIPAGMTWVWSGPDATGRQFTVEMFCADNGVQMDLEGLIGPINTKEWRVYTAREIKITAPNSVSITIYYRYHPYSDIRKTS